MHVTGLLKSDGGYQASCWKGEPICPIGDWSRGAACGLMYGATPIPVVYGLAPIPVVYGLAPIPHMAAAIGLHAYGFIYGLIPPKAADAPYCGAQKATGRGVARFILGNINIAS
jgi:hypothetical protein